MAGFEFSQTGSVSGIAREWRFNRYLPIYLAAVALGAALGVGLTMRMNGGDAAIGHGLPGASYVAPAPATEVRWAELPPINTHLDAEEIETDLPTEVLLALHGYTAPIIVAAPTASDPAPAAAPAVAVIPAAPQAAAAVVPVVPVVPVVAKPVAQPESAPAPAAAAPAPAAAAPVAKSDFYVPAVQGGAPSNLEQRLFAGMNSERAAAGLPALTFDAGLTTVARTRAQQMADQGYFSHVDPAGYTMYTALLKHFGYTSYAWAGENLAMNNASAAEASERSLTSLMNSPTHRANILANDFFRVGVGEVTTTDGRHIFAMIFLG
ncbi:MAG: CAP domain-containing protein [Anaerolineaceae bacterium]